MQPQDLDASVLEVVARRAAADRRPSRVDSTSSDLALLNGLDCGRRRPEGLVRYFLPVVPADPDLLHPYVAPAPPWRGNGGVARRCARGVFATPPGAVLLFGQKGSGKSTTQAWLAQHRAVAVIADDLSVIADGRVMPGPRCIDLRTTPAWPGVRCATAGGSGTACPTLRRRCGRRGRRRSPLATRWR